MRKIQESRKSKVSSNILEHIKNSLYIYKFEDSRVQEFRNLTIQEFEFKIEKSNDSKIANIRNILSKEIRNINKKFKNIHIWESEDSRIQKFKLYSPYSKKKLEKRFKYKESEN